MKIIAGIVSLSLMATLAAAGAVYVSDGSSADTQAKINAAADGDTVLIPAGSFTWTSGVSISGKGIKLQGAGAGRAVGRSTTSTTIGTGSKTFTTQSGLPIVAGQTLRVERTGTQMNPATGYTTGIRGYMIGTVTSYSGTSLTMDITQTGGSGTHGLWVISTSAETSITYSVAGTMLTLNEDASHHVDVSGIRFLVGSPGSGVYMISFSGTTGGKPILLHDCYFENSGSTGNLIAYVNRGVVWNCSFLSFPFSMSGLAFKIANNDGSSWSTPSTMGAGDTSGTSNFYFEDCDFHAFLNSTDLDNNSRTVMRYCVFDNAGVGTHGADSSYYGVRHYEFYNNTFIFNNLGSETFNMNWLFFLRGGTGVFTDNALADINSSWWGNKAEFRLAVLNLRENWGVNPCWGAGIAGVQYPAPRQVGFGYVTGTAGNDSVAYKGDSEPLYIWNNSGTYSFTAGDGSGSCVDPDSASDYVVAGRDYFNGTAKPNYTKYTYPHPMRSGQTGGGTAPQISTQPANASVSLGQAAAFTVQAAGTSPLAYQWQKNLVNIPGATSSTYDIPSAQTNDAASYRCILTNAYGAATSSAATLTVTVMASIPASVLAGPQNATVTVGQSAVFSVTSAGTSPLTYQWQKDAANIAGANAATYAILSAQTNDAGSYRCVVSNAYGSATSAAAILTVASGAMAGNARYVDFTAGNDGNPGTISSPWKYCPGMVGWSGAATLEAGDTVYFDRSDTWPLGANASGAGFDLKAGVHYVGNVWNPASGAGTRALIFAAGEHESGVVRIWEDHATLPTWLEGFEINANNQRANLVDINHAHWKTGLTKAVKRVENCLAYGNSGDSSQGYYKYGIIVSDNSSDASGWVANVEILNTVIHTIARDGFCMYPGNNGMVSNIVIRGCEVYDTGNDPSYSEGHGYLIKGNVKNAVVEYSYAHDVNSSAIFINGPEAGSGPGPSGLALRYNLLQTADNNGVIRFYGTGSKSADVYGNLVLPNEATGGLSLSGNSGTHAFRVYNNTFYNAFVDLGSPSSTGTIEFWNNLIFELDDVPLTDASQKITGHGNNVYFRSGGGTLVSSGGSSFSAASLLSGYEATASSSDPLFKNSANLPDGFTGSFGAGLAPNRDGLSLQVTSPALSVGANLGAPYNGSINSVARPASGAWNAGAYQMMMGGEELSAPTGIKATLGP